MKKLLPVLLLLIVAAIGCNKEKVYTDNLQGEWNVYKYLLYNVDRSSLFANANPGYSITFDGSNFIESTVLATAPDTIRNSVNGTFTFDDNDEKLVLNYVGTRYTPVTDTSGNVVDSIAVPYAYKREYTIFNLTKDHVQLRNDSSQLYMRKLEL